MAVYAATYRALLRWMRQDCVRRQLPLVASHVDALARTHEKEKIAPILQSLTDEFNPLLQARQYRQLTPEEIHISMTRFLSKPFRGEFFVESSSSSSSSSSDIELGFQALRLTADLQSALDEQERRRAEHTDREGIQFQIGDSVWHKKFKYRAIIIGWDKRPRMDVSQWDGVQGLPSGDGQPFYDVIVHSEDSHPAMPSERYAAQENLELIDCVEERHVNAEGLGYYFDHFSHSLGRFLPKHHLAYQYAMDEEEICAARNERYESLKESLETVLNYGRELADAVQTLEYAEEDEELRQMLISVVRGVSFGAEEGEGKDDVGETSLEAPLEERALEVLQVLHRYRQVLLALRSTRETKSDRSDIDFKVGQIVRHKQFGYRAVVFSWNHRPVIDVAGWEAVIDLPSGDEQPFYYTLPDVEDCVHAFGDVRETRYIAQENLELVEDIGEHKIHHHALPGDRVDYEGPFEGYDENHGIYVPRIEYRYQYPEDFPHEYRVRGDIVEALDDLNFEMLGNEGVRRKLEDALLTILRSSTDAETSKTIRFALGFLKSYHRDPNLRNMLRHAMEFNENEKHAKAIQTFDKVLEEDPDFLGARVSRGLHLYSRGLRIDYSPGAIQYYERALEDFEHTMKGDPYDIFGHVTAARALHMLGRQSEALPLYKKALEMDPWSDGTAAEKRKAEMEMQRKAEEENEAHVDAETDEDAGASVEEEDVPTQTTGSRSDNN
eukprot:g4260.t1